MDANKYKKRNPHWQRTKDRRLKTQRLTIVESATRTSSTESKAGRWRADTGTIRSAGEKAESAANDIEGSE